MRILEFEDTHYGVIKKVYSIWVCANPPKYRKSTISRYAVREENLVGEVSEKKENYDLLTVILICLGDSGDEKYAGILKLLDVLLSSEKEPEEKKSILRDDFGIKMTKELESGVSELCNLSKGIEEKGIQKGIEKGIQKGIQKGIREGILASIQNLMDSMGWTVEQAMTALQIPESDRVQYISEIKR